MNPILFLVISLAGCAVPALAQGGAAIVTLGQVVGPRQHGMGGAGVALPDAAQGMNFNPALAGLSFRPDRRSLVAANAWANIGDGPEWGHRDTDAPFLFERGPLGTPFTGYPGWYHPGIGYAGLDRQALSVEWIPEYRESFYALTLATAPDFLLPRGYRDPSWWDWTLGVTVKAFESSLSNESSRRNPASGIALDIGGAWHAGRIPLLPGVEAVAGAALQNLGAPVFYEEAAASDPLPEQWRLGWSLSWRPWLRRLREAAWSPLAVTITQELRREFHGRRPGGDPRVFPASLAHDLFRRPGVAWRERATHMGAEAEALGMACLRIGRYREGYYRGHAGGGVGYAWGYGLSTGPWLGPVTLRYDFARHFRTEKGYPFTFGTLHQKSLQAQLSW